MIKNIFTTAGILVLAISLQAQVPEVNQKIFPVGISSSRKWMEISGFHAARQQADELLNSAKTHQEKRDVLFILCESAFEDQEYEIAYRWSSQFLNEYPNDLYFSYALLIKGISGFQISRTEEALKDLTKFLETTHKHPRKGAAYFWRAMCKLEMKDESGAQSDVQQCYSDSSSKSYHDLALYGWALSLERSRKYSDAIQILERILNEFPKSQYLSDVSIRLSSIYLRIGESEKSRSIIERVDPLPPQHQEYSLIRSESEYRSGKYDDARKNFAGFISDYPGSKYSRDARYGLAWSYLKKSDYNSAIREYDLLGRDNDSLAFISLYQSATLALLQDRQPEALARYDTLTEKSPYDKISENAYYQMGLIHYRAKRYREARRSFQLAARLFPESEDRGRSYRMLGETNLALGDFSNAQYAFSRVRQLNADQKYLQPSMFQEAVCLYHLGRFKSSAQLLSEFINKFPDAEEISQVLVWRGEAYYQDGKFSDAEQSYSKAIQRYPNNPQENNALYGIAWSLFEQKKFAKSAESFENFIKNNRNEDRTIEAKLRQADCYYFLGDYEKSNSLYAAVGELKKNSRYAEYAGFQIAMAYIQRGESERGIEQLRLFMLKFPESLYNEVVQFNIGWTYFSKNQFRESLVEFKNLISKFPQSQLMPRVLFNMGDAFYNLKQFDSARIYYSRVTKEYPSSPLISDALQGLQFTYEAEGKPTAALAQIDTLMLTGPSGITAEELILKKGDILFTQGDFGEAVLQYQKVLSMKPDRNIISKAYYQMARAYEMENNSSQAARYYQRVLIDYSDMDFAPNVALALGINLLKSKQYKEAISCLENFDVQFPRSPLLSESKYNYGLAQQLNKMKAEAFKTFQMLIEKYPDDIFADRSRLQIAKIHYESKQFRLSIDTLEKIINRRNDDVAAEALLMIGENYLELKRPADALQAFKDVYDQYTEFGLLVERAHFGAGASYEKLRNKTSAKSEYQFVIKSGLDTELKKEAEKRARRIKR
ncbi:MAG: tetratricopeptide repeat protein [Ignavibacteriales bacterium]|nr:tetratricopeptide repeat protein [Ignavibacteriales bacterium]